ncbi:MAG: inositol monophosphatase [Rikenellaceae bacterium]|nr:inositol monophosphatase [Rikenellaceae bacterium]
MDYRAICEQVCRTARKAGEFIAAQRETFSYDRVEEKGRHDLVSYVDKEAEKMIVADLQQLLPQAGFITEEGTVQQASGQRFRWIIDPLDGTTNFIHGLPPYCVSLALMEASEVVVGVVYEAFSTECYYTWKGAKSYLDGKEIQVSTIDKFENTLTAVGLSHSSKETIGELLRQMEILLHQTSGIRRIGSAAIDLCYVANGRVDGFFQKNLSPWDVAAGALIARHAGAVVTDFSGGEDYVFGREILVANPSVYPDYRAKLF